ncbi:MAG: Hsp70 family protein [Candidatus Sulfopaludibacter sp.]|nr:Hsp70 family protein [Candidatus Sulfopaludibacter sp.]
MRLGIDFGTTRIIVAQADRGNYPLVNFEGPAQQIRDWFPPLVAARAGQRLYGWDAWEAQAEPGWTVVRSLKRWLQEAGPETTVSLGGQTVRFHQLLAELTAALRTHLQAHSSLRMAPGETLQAMLGIPANANTNQRYLTADAFRAAGFDVLGLLNEPSAASIEFGYRNAPDGKSVRKECLLVYDFGGGTFDASLVAIDDHVHSVIASAGVATMGGDDLDEILAELALEASGLPEADRESLTQAEYFRLHEECREKKETLNPNTRRVAIDLERVREGWPEVSIPVADFYDRCRPLLEETRQVSQDLLEAHPQHSIDTLYVTGGGSELPVVARLLRETFGRKVRRSAYMRSATAIGLAIHADARAGYVLKDRFTQNFGVWREGAGGHRVVFDLLFSRGTELPRHGQEPLCRERVYNPAHNVGHFRYLECTQLSGSGQPAGDSTEWDEIRFPFDRSLQGTANLSQLPVQRGDGVASHTIKEIYTCDASGTIAVTICDTSANYSRQYKLGRWSAKESEVTPGRPTRRRHGHRGP